MNIYRSERQTHLQSRSNAQMPECWQTTLPKAKTMVADSCVVTCCHYTHQIFKIKTIKKQVMLGCNSQRARRKNLKVFLPPAPAGHAFACTNSQKVSKSPEAAAKWRAETSLKGGELQRSQCSPERGVAEKKAGGIRKMVSHKVNSSQNP